MARPPDDNANVLPAWLFETQGRLWPAPDEAEMMEPRCKSWRLTEAVMPGWSAKGRETHPGTTFCESAWSTPPCLKW